MASIKWRAKITPVWRGTERLTALVGKSRTLLLAGTGTVVLDATDTEGIGLADQVFPQRSFEQTWLEIATAFASQANRDIKRVIRRTSTEEAVARFARLRVDDQHWLTTDRVLNQQ